MRCSLAVPLFLMPPLDVHSDGECHPYRNKTFGVGYPGQVYSNMSLDDKKSETSTLAPTHQPPPHSSTMTLAKFNLTNGTIVPIHFPTEFSPAELNKLGFNAAITLSWFTIIGIFTLLLATRNWRKVKETRCLT